jgi:hypothetical protein
MDATGDMHNRAAELAELRAELLAAERTSLEAGQMTAEEYLNAQANSILANDVDTAWLHIRWAWGNNGPCSNFLLCWTYIDSAGIEFSNGHFGPFVKIYRDGKSAHACIQAALDALYPNDPQHVSSDRGLAVEWVMASQIHNRPVFDWLRTHGDAVITALGFIPR